MDPHDFDLLARRFGETASRRRAVAAALGGALLLRAAAAGEATSAARDRKHSDPTPKTVVVKIQNGSPDHHVDVDSGASGPLVCCRYFEKRGIAPHGFIDVASGISPSLWVWIGGKYWLSFTNPLIGQPYISIALNGRYRFTSDCCLAVPFGATVEGRRGFKEGQTRHYDINGHVLTVTRNRDTPFVKTFTLQLPPVL